MIDAMLSRRHFLALSSACTALATGPALAMVQRAHAPLTLGLVQSALWPVDPLHAQNDLQRNAERMAETIRAFGPRCEWLAFHDRALTGGTPLAALQDEISLTEEAGDALFDIIAAAAHAAACWVSFGVPVRGTADSAARDRELPMTLSPQGKIFLGAWVDSDVGLIGLSTGEATTQIMADARRRQARALIAMSAGPRYPAANSTSSNANAPREHALGTPLLEVSAAHAGLQIDCPTRWLGDTAAFDADGTLLDRCGGAHEQTLLVTLRAGS